MAEFGFAVGDADQYLLQLAGVNISKGPGQSGYGDGKFFTAKQKSPGFVSREGTDGWIQRNKTNRRLIEVHIILMQTSPSNAFLSQLFALDDNNPNGAGVGSLVLKNLQGTTLIKATRAWIVQPSDVELDREPTMRDWTIEGVKSVWAVGT